MDIITYFNRRWEAEQPAFRRVLAAVPEGQLGYRPHERSTSAGDLAWQLADEQRALSELLDTGRTEYAYKKHPETVAEIVAAWDAATEELRKRLKSVDQAKWDSEGVFVVGGQEVWKEDLGGMLWGFLFDMVHHRGQLSTYLRPMGGKVPSIYGPSGDDQG